MIWVIYGGFVQQPKAGYQPRGALDVDLSGALDAPISIVAANETKTRLKQTIPDLNRLG